MVKDAVVILCGGSSKRMGKDKATLIYNGKSFLEHAIIKAIELSNRVIISINTKEQKKFYTTFLNNLGNFNETSIQFLIDEFDFDGPLNGVFTSITYGLANNFEYLQFIPIDIPAIMVSDLIQLRSVGRSNNIAISGYIAEESFISTLFFHLNLEQYKETWNLLLNSVNKLLSKRITSLFRIAPTLFLLKIPEAVSTRFNNINTKAEYRQLLKQEFEEIKFTRSQLTNSPSKFRKQIMFGVNLELLKEELIHSNIPHLRKNIKQDITFLD